MTMRLSLGNVGVGVVGGCGCWCCWGMWVLVLCLGVFCACVFSVRLNKCLGVGSRRVFCVCVFSVHLNKCLGVASRRKTRISLIL